MLLRQRSQILHLNSPPQRHTGENSLVVSTGADCCLTTGWILSGEEILQVLLPLETLFSSPSFVEIVNAYIVKNDRVSLKSLNSSPALFQGALLSIQVLQAPTQGPLDVQTLQLRGIRFLRLDLKALSAELIAASMAFLSCRIRVLLVSRYSHGQVGSLGIFAQISEQMVQLGIQPESVLVGWVVDTGGVLQPPVCLEMEVFEVLKDTSSPAAFVALLQKQPIPQGPSNRSHQTQYDCFHWKTTRDPDAPSAEEQRAKRL